MKILTKKETIQSTKNESIDYILVDFSSLQNVKAAAIEFNGKHNELDILINNAGVWEMERKLSKDGIEMNFAVNHLAPFLLTNLLIPILKNAKAARIVNTSSMAHRRNILDLNDIEFSNQTYNGVSTYSQSKLCNLLFTLHLTKELKGTNIIANSVHPGYVQSNLFENMGSRNWGNVLPASDGARSTIYAALSEELEGENGKYIYHENEEKPTDMALDSKLAQQLWDLSLKYVNKYLN
jgi:NAD(P)-dependent dehydrogenase (short-subunit alcohol dehydrogenase family)